MAMMYNPFFLEKHSTLLLVIVVFSLSYSLFMYKNYLFVFVVAMLLTVFAYQNPDVLSKHQKQKREISKIIESFDLEEFGTNLYDIYKRPKSFKYMFVKPDILENLLTLNFTRKFNKELYTKTFVVLEKFLKMYYNAITDRIDKKMALDTITDLHKEFKSYRDEMKMNVPIMAKHIKRFKDQTLHHVIDENYLKIDKFMKKKIQILRASIEDKIK